VTGFEAGFREALSPSFANSLVVPRAHDSYLKKSYLR